jgi:HK97 family phage major capsid protein
MSDQATTPQEVMEAVNGLREKMEKAGTNSPEFKEMQDKVEGALKQFDEFNQEVVSKMEMAKKASEEANERAKAMEQELLAFGKSGGKKGDYKNTPEYKALQLYAQKGEARMDSESKALLRSDDNADGGYMVMPEMDNMIIKNITEISPVRSVARVRTVGKKTLTIPTRKTIPTATYEGEAASGDDSQSTYGSESLTCYRLTTTVPFTMDLLMDSSFDLESNIMQDVSEAFAFTEGNKFVLGTGAKQPEGFLSAAAGIPTKETAANTTIDGDDLIKLTGELKVGYMPMFAFNRRSLAFFRTLKGNDGQFIWQPNLAEGAPSTLAGERYVLFEDMPNIFDPETGNFITGNKPVVYADFTRGYTITDRTGMEMIRDPYSQKRNNIIELTFHKYNHGQVVLKEAFVALENKA